MANVLVEHAKLNIWQEPRQDKQFNIGLGRLTKNGGFVGSTTVLWHRVLSPTRHTPPRKFHHVYQIGQISPITLNIVNAFEQDTWMPLEEIVNELDVLIEVYFESGAVVPLGHIWIMRDFTNNIILCVYHDRSIDYGTVTRVNESTLAVTTQRVNCDNDRLVTRFYSNALQTNSEFNASSSVQLDSVKTTTKLINGAASYNEFITAATDIRTEFSNRGMGLWYEDGFLVNAPVGHSTEIDGKIYRLVWDETFKFQQSFALKNLPVFTSTLDLNRTKYLLLCDTAYDVIDFYDDVDFYLVSGTPTRFKGIYINRAHAENIRQVTHNTYSIDAELIQWYVRQHEFLSDIDTVYIRIQAREGGMSRGVFSQANRIDELFRLPYDNITNAFKDTDSLVKEWRAQALEDSAYVALMGAESLDVTPELVTAAYGYPGISQTVVNPVHAVLGGSVTVPSGLQLLDTETGQGVRSVFCYDNEGLYLGYFNNTTIRSDIPVTDKFTSATTTECFRMRAVNNSQFAGITYNRDVKSHSLQEYGFRAYVCGIFEGIPSEEWEDITGQPFYTYTPGGPNKLPELIWDNVLLESAGLVGCVKVNKYVLVNSFQFNKSTYSGYLSFVLTSLHNWDGEFEVRKQTIPSAVVEVFANGEQLIEGIDYYLNFPVLVINNTSVCNSPSVSIVVRSYGCGDPETMKPYPPVEVGFVTAGYLSVDGQYDISLHRTNKVVVNSRLVDKSSVRFSEYALNGELYPTDGRPYMVQDYIPNVEAFATRSTTDLYREMCETDRRLGDYLTQFLPEPDIIRPLVQTDRWSLVSPVVSTILQKMKEGYMDDSVVPLTMSIEDINNWFDPFRWLLEYDPAFNDLNESFVHIRPHPHDNTMSCSARQYRFIEQICSFYLNNRVDLTPYVEIG